MEQKFTNFYGWGEGRYGINLILPNPLKQFETTEKALATGHLPVGTPKSWDIGNHNFQYEKASGVVKKTIADLILDELDIPHKIPDAYVIGAGHIIEPNERIGGGPIGEYFKVNMQFFKREE